MSMSAAESTVNVYNLPKLMSSINRKQYHNVDLQGNAQLYTVAIKSYGTKLQTIAKVAPDTYVTKRAIKAWHDARVAMFKRGGFKLSDLQPYARTLRPYFNVNHENNTHKELDQAISSNNTSTDDGTVGGPMVTPGFKGAEWTYSRAAVSTPAESVSSGNINEFDLVDSYSFTLLDESVSEATTADDPDESGGTTDEDSFVSVGIIAEWLDSFRRSRTGDSIPSETEIDADNALLQLASQQGMDKEEVLEIVQDIDREQRPWDKTGAQYYTPLPVMFDNAVSGETSTSILRVPCGLLQLTMTNNHSAQESVYSTIEVLSIEDM